MALRRRIERKTKPVEEEIEDVEVEEVLEPDDEEMDLEDEEEEPVKPVKKAKPVAAPAKPVAATKPAPAKVAPKKATPAPVVEEDDEEMEDEEPIAKVAAKKTAPAKKEVSAPVLAKVAPAKKEVAPVVEEAEDEELEADEDPTDPKKAVLKISKVHDTELANLMAGILDWMQEGKAINIQLLKPGLWQLSPALVSDAGSVAKKTRRGVDSEGKLHGKAYWNEVINPEYFAWNDEWHSLSYNEKVARAKKAGVEWTKHENPKVDVIHLTEAYRKSQGIEKYKEQYKSASSRAAVRG